VSEESKGNLHHNKNFLRAEDGDIFFIGFGYDITNLKRLRMPNNVSGRNIQGTCFGLKRREIETVRTNFQNAFGISLSLAAEYSDAYLFLREFANIR
jgi:hypothetical protein